MPPETDPPAKTAPPAPSTTPPTTPAPATPPAPPTAPLPAVEVKGPDAKGPVAPTASAASFYVNGGYTSSTTTTNGTPAAPGSTVQNGTLTVTAGATGTSRSDRDGDGRADWQAEAKAYMNRQTTAGQSTTTTGVEAAGRVDFGRTEVFGSGSYTSTVNPGGRLETTRVEGGLTYDLSPGRTPQQVETQAAKSTLRGELSDLYVNGAAAQKQLERLDGGFSSSGKSFAEMATLISTNGAALGRQNAAGLLNDPKQVGEAVGALALQTESAAKTLGARDPDTYRGAQAAVAGAYNGFKAAYGPDADARWTAFQADARANGYASAAASLPESPSMPKELRAGAASLATYGQTNKSEYLNAAIDVQAIQQYRTQNPTAPTTPAPTQTTPAATTPTTPATTPTAPEPAGMTR